MLPDLNVHKQAVMKEICAKEVTNVAYASRPVIFAVCSCGYRSTASSFLLSMMRSFTHHVAGRLYQLCRRSTTNVLKRQGDKHAEFDAQTINVLQESLGTKKQAC